MIIAPYLKYFLMNLILSDINDFSLLFSVLILRLKFKINLFISLIISLIIVIIIIAYMLLKLYNIIKKAGFIENWNDLYGLKNIKYTLF